MIFTRDAEKDEDYIYTYYTKSEIVVQKNKIINLQLQGWSIDDAKEKRFYDDLIRFKIKKCEYLRNITVFKTDTTTESTNEST
ncbi:MAG: hypothetical protein CMB64_03540 [Euryarchaeota archaeon]|nr:hypothetical protein [Euryarchaeota archaeon]|tara:strand:+ start:382 stop:630 length:249 start_codon:yes stop_codon:yes gene_type:complete